MQVLFLRVMPHRTQNQIGEDSETIECLLAAVDGFLNHGGQGKTAVYTEHRGKPYFQVAHIFRGSLADNIDDRFADMLLLL